MKRRTVWGEIIEIPEKPPKPTPAQKRRLEAQRRNQERRERETTDIEEWLNVSGPSNLEELALLRIELSRKRGMPVPPFSKNVYQSYDEMRDIWKITGHTKSLVLPSDKARRYFRKRLKLWEGTLKLHQEIGITLPSRKPPGPPPRASLFNKFQQQQE